MKLLYSWPCQVILTLTTLWMSFEIAPLLFLAGLVSLSTMTQLVYVPQLVYCTLSFGLPLAVLVIAVFSAKAQGNQLALSENTIGMLVIKRWQTLNLLLLFVFFTTFVILRAVAAWKIAAIVQALER